MAEDTASTPASEQPEGPLSVMSWLSGAPEVPWHSPPRLRYRDLLREVIDPELGVNIVDLGLVYDIEVVDGVARVRMTLTTPGCPLGRYLDDEVRACLWGAPGVDEVDVQIVWEPPWEPEMMSDAAKKQLGWRL